MARTSGDALVVSVEARLTQIEKSMQRAQSVTSKGFGALSKGSAAATMAIERDFDRAARNVDRNVSQMSRRAKEFGSSLKGGLVGSFGAGFVGGAVASLLTELPRVFGDAVKSIVELRGEAAKAGVSFEAFQAIQYAAQQTGVSIAGLTDGLKEMQLRADEFIVTGKGPAAEAFARLGFGADDVAAGLRDPIMLMDEIIRRLKTMDQAAQIRIMDEIFGGSGGEEFLKFLAGGARGLREMTNEAKAVGGVLGEEVGKRAAEIDAQFQRIATTVGTSLKGAVVSVVHEVAQLIELLSSMETRSANSIMREIADREQAIRDVEAAWGPALGGYVQGENAEDLQRLRTELLQRAIGGGPTPVPTRDVWFNQGGGGAIGDDGAMNFTPAGGGGGGGGPASATRDLANALDLSAVSARSSAAAYFEAVDAADKLGEAQAEAALKTTEAYTSIGRDALGGFITDLRRGVSAADAFAGALDRIGDRLLDMVLDAAFNPANFVGLFGGGGAPMNLIPKAAGGPVRRGGGYLVGERGPEMFVPSSAGSIIPNQRLAAPGGGRGGDANVSVNVINASGEKVETRERRTDLGRTVEVLVGKALGSGRLDAPMAARYGAKPLTTRRGK